MRWLFLLSAAVSAAALPHHSQAQGAATRAAVGRLLSTVTVPAALRPSLQAAMTRVLAGDELRYRNGAGYSVMGCDDTEMSARLVDLNGDATPEVHVQAGGTCVGGMAGSYNWVFIRGAGGDWRANLTFNGGLLPLTGRSHGFVDVVVAGPGFCAGVWRYDGREYAHLCNSAEGSARCTPPCPRTLNRRESADDLPAFDSRGAPRA